MARHWWRPYWRRWRWWYARRHAAQYRTQLPAGGLWYMRCWSDTTGDSNTYMSPAVRSLLHSSSCGENPTDTPGSSIQSAEQPDCSSGCPCTQMDAISRIRARTAHTWPKPTAALKRRGYARGHHGTEVNTYDVLDNVTWPDRWEPREDEPA